MDADDQRIAAYLPRLADALWRFREDPNWATQGALITACGAIWGDEWAKNQLDTNPAWSLPTRDRGRPSEVIGRIGTSGYLRRTE